MLAPSELGPPMKNPGSATDNRDIFKIQNIES